MLPWTHIHMTPDTTVLPCCIGNFKYKNGIPRGSNIEDSINSDFMKNLRLAMLKGQRSGVCKTCYKAEKTGNSFRQDANNIYGKYIDEVIENTGADGTLHDFKMRYYDIRFSNVCNFKCRTCNSGYSSLWEAEDLKHGNRHQRVDKYDIPKLVKEIITHVPHMDYAYFAGGEPLITEEHYIILDEILRQGRTDIQLSYNTNLSNLNFKNRDIIKMWEQFDTPVRIYASIDHYGSKAEYIRTGTNWEQVEKNIRTIKELDCTFYCITSTISVMNYLTLGDFLLYFLENGLWPQGAWQMNPVWDPAYFSPCVLPTHLKNKAQKDIAKALKTCRRTLGVNQSGKSMLDLIEQFHETVESDHLWDSQESSFKQEVARLDGIRNESFLDVFPELEELING